MRLSNYIEREVLPPWRDVAAEREIPQPQPTWVPRGVPGKPTPEATKVLNNDVRRNRQRQTDRARRDPRRTQKPAPVPGRDVAGAARRNGLDRGVSPARGNGGPTTGGLR